MVRSTLRNKYLKSKFEMNKWRFSEKRNYYVNLLQLNLLEKFDVFHFDSLYVCMTPYLTPYMTPFENKKYLSFKKFGQISGFLLWNNIRKWKFYFKKKKINFLFFFLGFIIIPEGQCFYYLILIILHKSMKISSF